MLTIGVDEEFLLLEPDGSVAPVAADVVRLAGPDGRLRPEQPPYRLETASAACTRLDELYTELLELRTLAARSAARAGVRLVASGAPPFGTGAGAGGGMCACRVRIGVADPTADLLARLGTWLPALLALTANSPFADGADSGWSSFRNRLPADRYLVARRPGRSPSIEIRVADTCLSTQDTLLFAAVVRALVATLVDEALEGRPVPVRSPTSVDPRLRAAACHGLVPAGPGAAAVSELVWRLLGKVWPALDAAGDAEPVYRQLVRLTADGTGAERQRRLWERTAGPAEFVAALATETAPGTRLTLHG